MEKLRNNASQGCDLSPGDPVAEWAVKRIEALELALHKLRKLNVYTVSQGVFIDPYPERFVKFREVQQIVFEASASTNISSAEPK
jgi:hypothetical protein